MKKISTIIIIIGIIVGMYPLADRAYTKYEQRKALSEFYGSDEGADSQPERQTSEEYAALGGIFSDIASAASSSDVSLQAASSPIVVPQKESSEPKILGVLKISSINLTLPILDGASLQNMKIGAGRIKGTGNIGQVGNVALAAHRSHTHGRFFNRLDELQTGDTITITTFPSTYEYTIYEKLVVKPNDVSVLSSNKREKRLTLITCHPLYNPTGRLVIRALQK